MKSRGRTFILIKPTTYMNLSGKAVAYWMQQEKIALDHLLIICDDLALPFGKIRIRQRGSDGGHNGLKNITESLSTSDFARLRFGIGNEFTRGHQVDYVLGQWTDEETATLVVKSSFVIPLIHSLFSLSLQRFVAACDSAFGIKRESGASPELSRSCKSRRWAVHTLTATVRKDGKANRQR